MKWLALALIVAAVFAVAVAAALLLPKRQRGNRQQPKAKPLMTVREQPMYWRLVEAFPGEVVLAQVAFSALLTARDRATRNTFDRKVADFVVCTKGLRVTAVVELDDSSHKGREVQDTERQGLLERAGYTVLRFKHVPDAAALRAAINIPTQITANAMTE